jgi:UDP-GlcNAc:undecaprenyl-phosphate GlcNAc-1-phosphate transferase
MACATVLVTYYRPGRPSHLAIGIPLMILAIPLYDTASVVYIRLKEGRPIMRGDTSHFSHRLVDLGMSRRTAVATIHLACLAIGLPATVLWQLSEQRGLLIVGQALLVLTLVAMLEHAGRTRANDASRETFSRAKPPVTPDPVDTPADSTSAREK